MFNPRMFKASKARHTAKYFELFPERNREPLQLFEHRYYVLIIVDSSY